MKHFAALIGVLPLIFGLNQAGAEMATQHTGMTVVSRDVACSIFNWFETRALGTKVFYFTHIELEPEDENTLTSPFRLSGIGGRMEARPFNYRYAYHYGYPFSYRFHPRFIPRLGSIRTYNIVPVSDEMLIYELLNIAPTVAFWPNYSINSFYWPSSQNRSSSWYYNQQNDTPPPPPHPF